jgi:hypothetical protein
MVYKLRLPHLYIALSCNWKQLISDEWSYYARVKGISYQYQYIINCEIVIFKYIYFTTFWGKSWPWSYGSWIYNYLYNQCLSPLMWVRIAIRARCTTLCDKVSVTCDRLVVFSGSYGFLHQSNWPPRYNWNIVNMALNTITLLYPTWFINYKI